jgi:hypothetical protein
VKASRRLQADGRLLVIVCTRADGKGFDVLEWGPGPERWYELEHHCGPGKKYTHAQVAALTPVGVLIQDVVPA